MKKTILLLIVSVFLFVYPLSNFSLIIKENHISQSDTEEGISYIEKMDSDDVSLVEDIVKEAEKIREYQNKTTAEIVKEIIEKLENGELTYKKALTDVYFMGDSLMNGLEAYEVLSKKKVVSQVSATFEHLKKNYKKVIEKKPEVIVLHYGINMLGFKEESIQGFTRTYTKYVRKIKKALPETRVIISSIFPVDRKVATAKRFGRIKAYNNAIKEVCKQTGAEYLNNTPMFKDMEYLYGRDGIHFPENFYRNYWLLYLIEEMEII